MKIPSRYSVHIFALLTIVMWSAGNVLTRVAVRYYTPDALAFLRYAVAAAALAVCARMMKMRLPAPRDVPVFILGGILGFALYAFAFNAGLRTITASEFSFILSAVPIFTAILARVILKEKIGLLGWACVAGGFTGVGIIAVSGGGMAFRAGALWACFTAFLGASYYVFQRKLFGRYSPLEITTYCSVAGAAMLAVFAPNSLPQLIHAPAYQIVVLVILGVFPAAAAYLSWSYALSAAEKTSQVTNYMFFTPILTTLLGAAMISELPPASTYAGGALVLACVLLVNMRGRFVKAK